MRLLLSLPLLVARSVRAQVFSLEAPARLLTVQEQQTALDFVFNRTWEASYQGYMLAKEDYSNYSGMLSSSPMIAAAQEASSRGPRPHYQLAFDLNRMLQSWFGDAHFRVEVNETIAAESYKTLDVCLEWIPLFNGDHDEHDGTSHTSRGLVVTCNTEFAQVGDLVVQMGGHTPKDIFQELELVIPHENPYHIEEVSASWIVREDYLSHLDLFDENGGDNLSVPFVLGRDGTEHRVTVPLSSSKKSSMAARSAPSSFASFEILAGQSTGIFTLNACIFNEEYMSTLQEFWTNVLDQNLSTVVLDLRANHGGDATVIVPFLDWISSENESSLELFDVEQRLSTQLCEAFPVFCDPQMLGLYEQLGVTTTPDGMMTIPGSAFGAVVRSQVGAPPPPEARFGGDFFVLISGYTFSSAHIFAGVVQVNGLGTLVGTPTGNALRFGGNLINFPIPNTDLILYVTTSMTFINQSEASSHQDMMAVYPEIYVPTTREDLFSGRDAQLEFVLSRDAAPGASDLDADLGRRNEDSSGSSGGQLFVTTMGIWILVVLGCSFTI